MPPPSGPQGVDERPTFVLGMGCQKGGTTWLHDYLGASPQFVEGYRKEFHVFDSLDLVGDDGAPRVPGTEIFEKARRQLDRAQRGEPYRAKNLHWASMCGNLDFYFDYFMALLARRERFRATGDFTPTYGQLSVDRVAQIQRRFGNRGIRTVGLFLMRDPVERIWSQARMLAQRGNVEMQGVEPEEAVAKQYATHRYEARTRYDHTLDVIDAVFDPADRWIGFYEELFAEQPIREICEVVGVDFRDPELDVRSNASPKSDRGLPEDLVRTVAEHYRGVYQRVARRFPEKDLTQLWPSSRFVL